MSYSRVVAPRTSRTQRGRGSSSGTGGYQPRLMNRPTVDQGRPQFSDHGEELLGTNADSTGATSASSLEPRSLQSHGHYHVLTPNPHKNTKLKRTAEHEEVEFERLKANKKQRAADKLQLAWQPPMAVGGQKDLDEIRKDQERKHQMEAKFSKVRQRQKREEYHRQQREKEEEEIEKRKQVQRDKAKRLEAKRCLEQPAQREEMIRKRLERFDK